MGSKQTFKMSFWPGSCDSLGTNDMKKWKYDAQLLVSQELCCN